MYRKTCQDKKTSENNSSEKIKSVVIRKVIIHKTHEDFLISIDRLVVVSVAVLHGIIAVRDLCPVSREISGSKHIHEYEAIEHSMPIVVIGHMMFRQRCNRINGNFLFSIEFMQPCAC